MNIVTVQTPCGWQATESESSDIGTGDTEQEAVDDLCRELELPYSINQEEEQELEQWWNQLDQDTHWIESNLN